MADLCRREAPGRGPESGGPAVMVSASQRPSRGGNHTFPPWGVTFPCSGEQRGMRAELTTAPHPPGRTSMTAAPPPLVLLPVPALPPPGRLHDPGGQVGFT